MATVKQAQAVLGIDMSLRKFDLALLRGDKIKNKVFSNDVAGFETLHQWLDKQQVSGGHACMESTNIYGEALAVYLYDLGYTVSIVNPARIKGFAQSELSRTKTDKADAALTARFCVALKPAPWAPEPLEIRELQALVRRIEALITMRQQEVNRLHVAPEIIASDLQAHIDYLDTEIRDHIDNHPDLKQKKALLESIPGVGEATINVVLSEFARIERFRNAKALAAFLGVAPRERQSGQSVCEVEPLCPRRDAHSYVRRSLCPHW